MMIPMLALALTCSVFSKASGQIATSPKDKDANEHAEPVVPPELVECTKMRVLKEMKTATVVNGKGRDELSCNIKASGCTTLVVGKKYFLYDKKTRWKIPGAKDVTTLAFFQDWTVTYNQAENVALLSRDKDSDSGFGVYILDSFMDMTKTEEVQGLPQKASLDLQAKCAARSREVFRQWLLETPEYKKPGINAYFTNHYDAKANSCFIETIVTAVPVGNEFSTTKFVSDAFEGSLLANYLWISRPDKKYWEVPPMDCMVKGTDGKENHCDSDEEFQQMVRAIYGVVQ